MRYEAVGYDFIEIELPEYGIRRETDDQINKCNTERPCIKSTVLKNRFRRVVYCILQ
jgi:hypothetical protein